jgi:hypothetical protein
LRKRRRALLQETLSPAIPGYPPHKVLSLPDLAYESRNPFTVYSNEVRHLRDIIVNFTRNEYSAKRRAVEN